MMFIDLPTFAGKTQSLRVKPVESDDVPPRLSPQFLERTFLLALSFRSIDIKIALLWLPTQRQASTAMVVVRVSLHLKTDLLRSFMMTKVIPGWFIFFDATVFLKFKLFILGLIIVSVGTSILPFSVSGMDKYCSLSSAPLYQGDRCKSFVPLL